MSYRVGFGEDIHRLVEGRKLILGAVEIPFEKGLLGHSDADVVLHALSDALLTGVGEADIGAFFPDKDPSIEGIDSRKILAFAYAKVKEHGYRLANASLSILAEAPKLRPYIETMRKEIAKTMDVPAELIGIAAGTNEKLGPIGEGKAIKCTAVVCLEKE